MIGVGMNWLTLGLLASGLTMSFVQVNYAAGVDVTCDFTADNSIYKVYIDGVDKTSSVSGKLYYWRSRKTIKFKSEVSKIAFQANDAEEGCRNGGFAISCRSADPTWTISSNSKEGWKVYAQKAGGGMKDLPTSKYPPVVAGKKWYDLGYNPGSKFFVPRFGSTRNADRVIKTDGKNTQDFCSGSSDMTANHWFFIYQAFPAEQDCSLAGKKCRGLSGWDSSIVLKPAEVDMMCVATVAPTDCSTCAEWCQQENYDCLRAQDNYGGGCRLDPDHDRQSKSENGCLQQWGTQMCQCGRKKKQKAPTPAPTPAPTSYQCIGEMQATVFIRKNADWHLMHKPSGEVGMSPNKLDLDKWIITEAGDHMDHKVFITSYNGNQQLTDHEGKVGLTPNKDASEKWTIRQSGVGKMFITSHRNQQLMVNNGTLGMSQDAKLGEQWNIEVLSPYEYLPRCLEVASYNCFCSNCTAHPATLGTTSSLKKGQTCERGAFIGNRDQCWNATELLYYSRTGSIKSTWKREMISDMEIPLGCSITMTHRKITVSFNTGGNAKKGSKTRMPICDEGPKEFKMCTCPHNPPEAWDNSCAEDGDLSCKIESPTWQKISGVIGASIVITILVSSIRMVYDSSGWVYEGLQCPSLRSEDPGLMELEAKSLLRHQPLFWRYFFNLHLLGEVNAQLIFPSLVSWFFAWPGTPHSILNMIVFTMASIATAPGLIPVLRQLNTFSPMTLLVDPGLSFFGQVRRPGNRITDGSLYAAIAIMRPWVLLAIASLSLLCMPGLPGLKDKDVSLLASLFNEDFSVLDSLKESVGDDFFGWVTQIPTTAMKRFILLRGASTDEQPFFPPWFPPVPLNLSFDWMLYKILWLLFISFLGVGCHTSCVVWRYVCRCGETELEKDETPAGEWSRRSPFWIKVQVFFLLLDVFTDLLQIFNFLASSSYFFATFGLSLFLVNFTAQCPKLKSLRGELADSLKKGCLTRDMMEVVTREVEWEAVISFVFNVFAFPWAINNGFSFYNSLFGICTGFYSIFCRLQMRHLGVQ